MPTVRLSLAKLRSELRDWRTECVTGFNAETCPSSAVLDFFYSQDASGDERLKLTDAQFWGEEGEDGEGVGWPKPGYYFAVARTNPEHNAPALFEWVGAQLGEGGEQPVQERVGDNSHILGWQKAHKADYDRFQSEIQRMEHRLRQAEEREAVARRELARSTDAIHSLRESDAAQLRELQAVRFQQQEAQTQLSVAKEELQRVLLEYSQRKRGVRQLNSLYKGECKCGCVVQEGERIEYDYDARRVSSCKACGLKDDRTSVASIHGSIALGHSPDTTIVVDLAQEAKDGAWQALAEESAKRSRDVFLAQMKKMRAGTVFVNGARKFLNTEWGLSLWSLGLGVALPYVPKVQENAHVLRVATELRTGGFRHGFLAVADVLVDTITSVIQIVGVTEAMTKEVAALGEGTPNYSTTTNNVAVSVNT